MPAPPDLLLLFTPFVPRRATATGWTPDRQRCFIAALARMGVVSAAARSVGMSPRSAYQLRDRVRHKYSNWADTPMRPEDAATLGPGYVFSFAAAWDMALGEGLQRQIEAAAPVALEGEEVPVIRRGRIIGWQRKFNTRLALAALGAFRRSYEGSWFDHEARVMRETSLFVEKVERLMRLGPIEWPDPAPVDPPEALARMRKMRLEERIYGKRHSGLLDPYGPADRPPRTLAERAAEAAAKARAK